MGSRSDSIEVDRCLSCRGGMRHSDREARECVKVLETAHAIQLDDIDQVSTRVPLLRFATFTELQHQCLSHGCVTIWWAKGSRERLLS